MCITKQIANCLSGHCKAEFSTCCLNNRRYNLSFYCRGVAQLAARGAWDAEVGGSNPLAPTTYDKDQAPVAQLDRATDF